MVKHWPSGGSGEGGSDAHYGYGKYAVYPAHYFNQNMAPFINGAFKLNGKTQMASAVMPYYTIMKCYADSEGHVYDFGFGMNWKGVINDARTKKYNHITTKK